MWRDLWFRLRALFRRRAIETELDDELRFHFEQQVEKQMKEGLTRAEATRRARLEFGGLEQTKEECREARGVNLIDTLWQDVRFAIRILSKTPVIIVAVLSLALGIGANTAIFSLMDSVMLRLLPVQNPEQLLQVKFHSPASPNLRGTYTNPIWEQVRQRQDVFSGVIAWSPRTFDLAHGGEQQNVRGMYASGDYFTILGVPPVRGRVLTAADDQRGCGGAAVLGYGFWQQHYGGAENAIGSMLRLNGHSFPVIGVTPPRFFGTDVGDRFDVAIPICAEAIIEGKNSLLDERSGWWLLMIGRLKRGISREQAAARLNVLAPEIFAAAVPADWPQKDQEIFRKYTFATAPAATGLTGFSGFRDRYRRPLVILMVVVSLVLLIACANIASLMLARSAARQKEIAVRFSLGASRGRLIRQMLTESVVLSAAGALLGLLFARWSGALLVRLVSRTHYKIFLDLSMDGRILGFTAAIAVLTGLLFGVLPAFRATRVSLVSAMKATESHGNQSGAPFQAEPWIVASQVALSLVLLVGTGLFVRTFGNLVRLNPGFDRHNVLLITTNIHDAGISQAARASFYAQILERLRSIPGAGSVSQIWFTPFSGAEWNQDITVEGYAPPAGEEPLCWLNWITPEYFVTVRTPLLAGRQFNNGDTATSTPVAIVNESMARQFFAGTNPIGKYFRISDSHLASSQPLQIVGVVKDSKYESLREKFLPFAYVPVTQLQEPREESSFVIRTATAPSSTIPAARDAIGDVNKRASLQFRTLADQVNDSIVQERLLALLSSFFGALALLLTAIGLYGVLSYFVTQRTHEIGIRMALGAPPATILRLVVRRVGMLVLAGTSAGIVSVLWITRLAQQLLFGLTPNDAGTIAAAVLVLLGVALLASYLPVRRAMHMDPTVALRYE